MNLLTFTLIFLLSAAGEWEEPTEAEKVFALHVQPLFQQKCLACHGANHVIESGFDLTSSQTALAGGDSFGDSVIVPGRAEDSYLVAMVCRTEPDWEMPPKESEKLTAQEIDWLKNWIDGGSPWPDQTRVQKIYDRFAEGQTWPTIGGLSETWTNRKYKSEDLWAYQPLWNDPLNRFQDSSGHDVIDSLISDQQRAADVQPAPLADRRTLIRRLSFDLLGLPPEQSWFDSVINDPRDDELVVSELIDQFLQRPQYGEQWGRHWLDVVRYADSSGFANDWERPNAWRYRDYVIRSFNDDKPYDVFLTEQLAGDEIVRLRDVQPDRVRRFTSPKSELQIAAGFLRMGPWEQTAMSVAAVTRQQYLDDVTDSVGQVFLGHALQCCRCHDHKFDPIPTHDYYSFQAAFATTYFAEVDADWLPFENQNGMESDRDVHQRKVQATQRTLKELNRERTQLLQKWFADQALPYKTIQEAKDAGLKADQLPQKADYLPAENLGRDRIASKWKARFAWESDRYSPIAFSVFSGHSKLPKNVAGRLRKPQKTSPDKTPTPTYILTGGDLSSRSDAVRPAALSAVTGPQRVLPESTHNRRLALAEWMTDPTNTLTARVIVNRIWHYHFGRGLAGNPNNFGATGKKPTHPELLDWLAHDFVKNGWSIKRLHKQILLSRTYRRASTHPHHHQVQQADPGNRLYHTFVARRLEAEELRDSMLAVSGELNREVGGIPSHPDMNLEAALQPRMIMGTFAPAYVPDSTAKQRNRRSVYAIRLRGLRDPMMEIFNQPGLDKSCEIRDTSTISPQALTLLNGEETADRSVALAADILKAELTDQAAIERLAKRCWSRSPTPGEQQTLAEYWQQLMRTHSNVTFKSRDYPVTIVRTAPEENTGQTFSFTERLFAYEVYEHDLQPSDVNVRTRAFADVCLAVLNSNEFLFVD